MQRGRALFIKDLTYYSIRLPRSLLLSLFPLSFNLCLLSPFLMLSYFILSPSFPPATLTLLSFFLPASLHIFLPSLFTFSPSPHPPLCFCLLIHCAPFVSYVDVFAIGDPNQSTILAVSIAGGIVLLIFLVTCFVVSGR